MKNDNYSLLRLTAATRSCLLIATVFFALATQAQIKLSETQLKNSKVTQQQKEATERKLQNATLRDPALCISDEYYIQNAFPIYVLEDFTGKGVTVINKTKPVQGVGADQKGNVYEVGGSGTLTAYIKDIRKPGVFTGPLKNPTAVACDKQGRIYITDAELGQVIRIDDLDGKNLISFGSEGSRIGQFLRPQGIAIDKDGRIYIADFGNYRIVRIDDMNGEGWKTYDGAQYADIARQVVHVKDIALDSKNRLYYLRPDNGMIVRIDDMDGSKMKSYGGDVGGTDKGRFIVEPSGIAIDHNDKLYISDIGTGWITRFDDIDGNGRIILNKDINPNTPFRRPSHITLFYPVKEKMDIR